MAGGTIDPSAPYLIQIGDNVTFSRGVIVLAHDASLKQFLGVIKLGKVKIGNNVFIGAGAIILAGVEIGDNSIVGAGSVVTHDIPSNSVACGNPARVVSTLSEYLKKTEERMKCKPYYTKEFRFGDRKNLSKSQKAIVADLELEKYGYGEADI